MRTNEEIKSIIEQAFRPLQCAAEIWDHKQKLRFRVFDPNGQTVINVSRLVLRVVGADPSLAGIINDLRGQIEERRHTLEPWRMPDPDE